MTVESLTQLEMAALLSVTPRTLRDWEKAGESIPRNEDGTYPGPAVIAWEIGRHSMPEGILNGEQEKARRDKESADKLAMENAARRGELARVADVVEFVSDHNAASRAKLLSMPAKLSPQLVGINDPNVIAAAIRAELYAALAELAEWVPTGIVSDAPGSAGVEPAARSDRKRVGRRRAEAE